jgi:hypothetical protein
VALAVESYDDDIHRFRLTAAAPDRAVVLEIAYPGWCATVNGRPVEIDRATIRGIETPLCSVPVQPGENIIEFRYRPFRAMLFGCNWPVVSLVVLDTPRPSPIQAPNRRRHGTFPLGRGRLAVPPDHVSPRRPAVARGSVSGTAAAHG